VKAKRRRGGPRKRVLPWRADDFDQPNTSSIRLRMQADGVDGMPGGPAIDRRASAALILGDMRRGAAFAQLGDELARIVTIVHADLPGDLANHLGQYMAIIRVARQTRQPPGGIMEQFARSRTDMRSYAGSGSTSDPIAAVRAMAMS
jgi:hypothetical protein